MAETPQGTLHISINGGDGVQGSMVGQLIFDQDSSFIADLLEMADRTIPGPVPIGQSEEIMDSRLPPQLSPYRQIQAIAGPSCQDPLRSESLHAGRDYYQHRQPDCRAYGPNEYNPYFRSCGGCDCNCNIDVGITSSDPYAYQTDLKNGPESCVMTPQHQPEEEAEHRPVLIRTIDGKERMAAGGEMSRGTNLKRDVISDYPSSSPRLYSGSEPTSPQSSLEKRDESSAERMYSGSGNCGIPCGSYPYYCGYGNTSTAPCGSCPPPYTRQIQPIDERLDLGSHNDNMRGLIYNTQSNMNNLRTEVRCCATTNLDYLWDADCRTLSLVDHCEQHNNNKSDRVFLQQRTRATLPCRKQIPEEPSEPPKPKPCEYPSPCPHCWGWGCCCCCPPPPPPKPVSTENSFKCPTDMCGKVITTEAFTHDIKEQTIDQTPAGLAEVRQCEEDNFRRTIMPLAERRPVSGSSKLNEALQFACGQEDVEGEELYSNHKRHQSFGRSKDCAHSFERRVVDERDLKRRSGCPVQLPLPYFGVRSCDMYPISYGYDVFGEQKSSNEWDTKFPKEELYLHRMQLYNVEQTGAGFSQTNDDQKEFKRNTRPLKLEGEISQINPNEVGLLKSGDIEVEKPKRSCVGNTRADVEVLRHSKERGAMKACCGAFDVNQNELREDRRILYGPRGNAETSVIDDTRPKPPNVMGPYLGTGNADLSTEYRLREVNRNTSGTIEFMEREIKQDTAHSTCWGAGSFAVKGDVPAEPPEVKPKDTQGQDERLSSGAEKLIQDLFCYSRVENDQKDEDSVDIADLELASSKEQVTLKDEKPSQVLNASVQSNIKDHGLNDTSSLRENTSSPQRYTVLQSPVKTVEPQEKKPLHLPIQWQQLSSNAVSHDQKKQQYYCPEATSNGSGLGEARPLNVNSKMVHQNPYNTGCSQRLPNFSYSECRNGQTLPSGQLPCSSYQLGHPPCKSAAAGMHLNQQYNRLLYPPGWTPTVLLQPRSHANFSQLHRIAPTLKNGPSTPLANPDYHTCYENSFGAVGYNDNIGPTDYPFHRRVENLTAGADNFLRSTKAVLASVAKRDSPHRVGSLEQCDNSSTNVKQGEGFERSSEALNVPSLGARDCREQHNILSPNHPNSVRIDSKDGGSVVPSLHRDKERLENSLLCLPRESREQHDIHAGSQHSLSAGCQEFRHPHNKKSTENSSTTTLHTQIKGSTCNVKETPKENVCDKTERGGLSGSQHSLTVGAPTKSLSTEAIGTGSTNKCQSCGKVHSPVCQPSSTSIPSETLINESKSVHQDKPTEPPSTLTNVEKPRPCEAGGVCTARVCRAAKPLFADLENKNVSPMPNDLEPDLPSSLIVGSTDIVPSEKSESPNMRAGMDEGRYSLACYWNDHRLQETQFGSNTVSTPVCEDFDFSGCIVQPMFNPLKAECGAQGQSYWLGSNAYLDCENGNLQNSIGTRKERLRAGADRPIKSGVNDGSERSLGANRSQSTQKKSVEAKYDPASRSTRLTAGYDNGTSIALPTDTSVNRSYAWAGDTESDSVWNDVADSAVRNQPRESVSTEHVTEPDMEEEILAAWQMFNAQENPDAPAPDLDELLRLLQGEATNQDSGSQNDHSSGEGIRLPKLQLPLNDEDKYQDDLSSVRHSQQRHSRQSGASDARSAVSDSKITKTSVKQSITSFSEGNVSNESSFFVDDDLKFAEGTLRPPICNSILEDKNELSEEERPNTAREVSKTVPLRAKFSNLSVKSEGMTRSVDGSRHLRKSPSESTRMRRKGGMTRGVSDDAGSFINPHCAPSSVNLAASFAANRAVNLNRISGGKDLSRKSSVATDMFLSPREVQLDQSPRASLSSLSSNLSALLNYPTTHLKTAALCGRSQHNPESYKAHSEYLVYSVPKIELGRPDCQDRNQDSRGCNNLPEFSEKSPRRLLQSLVAGQDCCPRPPRSPCPNPCTPCCTPPCYPVSPCPYPCYPPCYPSPAHSPSPCAGTCSFAMAKPKDESDKMLISDHLAKMIKSHICEVKKMKELTDTLLADNFVSPICPPLYERGYESIKSVHSVPGKVLLEYGPRPRSKCLHLYFNDPATAEDCIPDPEEKIRHKIIQGVLDFVGDNSEWLKFSAAKDVSDDSKQRTVNIEMSGVFKPSRMKDHRDAYLSITGMEVKPVILPGSQSVEVKAKESPIMMGEEES